MGYNLRRNRRFSLEGDQHDESSLQGVEDMNRSRRLFSNEEDNNFSKQMQDEYFLEQQQQQPQQLLHRPATVSSIPLASRFQKIRLNRFYSVSLLIALLCILLSPKFIHSQLSVPDAPKDAELTVLSGDSLHLAWTPPLSDGGAAVQSYRVEWDTDYAWDACPSTKRAHRLSTCYATEHTPGRWHNSSCTESLRRPRHRY